MKNYNSIDLVKFVMALCVVTIHTFLVDGMEPSIIRDLLHALICSAVPFFFITSAYFVMQRENDADVFRYWKRIFQLYLIWCVINYVGLRMLGHDFSMDNLRNAIYDMLANGFNVLWYMWGIIVVLPFLRKIRCGGAYPIIFLAIAICAYLFNRAYTHYGSLENPGQLWTWAAFLFKGKYIGLTNICLALTYLSIGAFFAKSGYTPKRKLSLLLIILGAVEMHFEKYKGVALGVPVIAFGLFPIVKDWSLNSSWLSFRWLRKMSTLIYFIHGVVIVGISQVVSGLDMCEFVIWCIVILCCIAISALLLKLSKLKRLQWIAKLY